MDYPEHGIQTLDHEDERESWSFALRACMPSLRGLVTGYCLYEERRTALPVHQHLPQPGFTFIIGLEGRMEVEAPSGDKQCIEAGQGMLAGLHTAPARTRSLQRQRGMEIEISPLGAHLLLEGLPMDELTNRVITMDELLGADGRELGERLVEARSPADAFDVVESFLAARMHAPRRALPEGLGYAWNMLASSHGRVQIREISGELGWSRRRLVETFRQSVGLTPKTLARVLRFDHALSLWKADPQLPWADLAFDAGYHDQAHFSREVRALSGQTPTELSAQLLPESGGIAA